MKAMANGSRCLEKQLTLVLVKMAQSGSLAQGQKETEDMISSNSWTRNGKRLKVTPPTESLFVQQEMHSLKIDIVKHIIIMEKSGSIYLQELTEFASEVKER